MRELEKKQAGKDQEREKWYQERRQEEEARREREKKARVQRQEEFEAAQKKLFKEQEVLNTINLFIILFCFLLGISIIHCLFQAYGKHLPMGNGKHLPMTIKGYGVFND